MKIETVDEARAFLSRVANTFAAVSLGAALLMAVTDPGHHGLRFVAVVAVLGGILAGVFKARAWYVSDADLRREFDLGPPPRASWTLDGLTGAVLRCKGVTRAIVFDDPEVPYTVSVVAWGGDEAEVRSAIGEHRCAAVAAIVHVRSSGPGWRVEAEVRGRSWHCTSRPRVDRHPTQDKLRWEVS